MSRQKTSSIATTTIPRLRKALLLSVCCFYSTIRPSSSFGINSHHLHYHPHYSVFNTPQRQSLQKNGITTSSSRLNSISIDRSSSPTLPSTPFPSEDEKDKAAGIVISRLEKRLNGEILMHVETNEVVEAGDILLCHLESFQFNDDNHIEEAS